MSIILYGLKNCDSCKKALKQLEAEKKSVTFVDIRDEADLPKKIPYWLGATDTKTLLNTRSATWRALEEDDKARAENGELVELLLENPTLVKRPVIEQGELVYVGWNKEVQLSLV